MHKILFYNKFIKRLYMFRALCAHHQVKIVYTASGIIVPIGGRSVHRSSLNLCTGRPPIDVMIPDAVYKSFKLVVPCIVIQC